MKRTAIIISKQLNKGQAANASAILMGQIALLQPDLYDANAVQDADGQKHAAVRFSVVLLEANGTEQLVNFCAKLALEHPGLVFCIFAQGGQILHNKFDEYRALVSSKSTAELAPVGVAVSGEDASVRAATKKFSLLQ